jgi:hypothetical protein
MNIQLLQSIVREIDELVENQLIPTGVRQVTLVELSLKYWKTVFPELHTPGYDALSIDDKEARWSFVRGKDGFLKQRILAR